MGLFIDANGTTKNSFGIKDTNSSHFLHLVPGSDLTADRNLTITIGDAARTITLSGNPTLDDWFDQSVKQNANVVFANLTLYNAISSGGYFNFQSSELSPAVDALVGSFSSLVNGGGSAEVAASIRFYTDAATGLNDVPGRISFWTTPDGTKDPVERMRITNAGNVLFQGHSSDLAHGITAYGALTSSYFDIHPNTAANGGAVMVGMSDSAAIAGAALYGVIGVTDTTDSAPALILSGGKKSGTGGVALGDAETVFQILNWSTGIMTGLGNGNVGVGTVTPAARLEVRKDANGQVESLRFTTLSTTWTAGYGPRLTFYGGTDGRILAAITGAVQTNSSGSHGYMGFYTRVDDTSEATEKMRISASGQVGIGTTSPDLRVSAVAYDGLLTIKTASAAQPALVLLGNLTANGPIGDLVFANEALGITDSRIGVIRYNRLDANNSSSFDIYSKSAGNWVLNLTFAVGGAATFISSVRTTNIICSGDTGIYRSDNSNAIYLSGGSSAGTGSHILLIGGAHGSLPNNMYLRSAFVDFHNVAGSISYFAHNGSAFYINTGSCYIQTSGASVYSSAWPGSATGTPIITSGGWLYYLTSTERNKINIERKWTSPLLEDFLKITPIRYEGKPQPEGKDDPKDKVSPHVLGFSAEEIHDSGVPGLINYDDELLPFSLREHGFLVYHHLVLQDLEKRLKILEKK